MAKEICLSLDMSFVSVMDDEGNTTSLPLNSGVKISNENGEISISPANPTTPGDDETVLPVNDSLWQISYDGTAQRFYIVGVTDIDSSRTAEQHNFELCSNDVYFRRDGDSLVLDMCSN